MGEPKPLYYMRSEVDIIENKHRFHVRFSDKQWAKLLKNSANAGLSKAEFIRKLVDEKEIKPKPPETYKQLIYEISAIGNNINQIAHQANTMEHTTKEQADNAVLLVNKCIELIREKR